MNAPRPSNPSDALISKKPSALEKLFCGKIFGTAKDVAVIECAAIEEFIAADKPVKIRSIGGVTSVEQIERRAESVNGALAGHKVYDLANFKNGDFKTEDDIHRTVSEIRDHIAAGRVATVYKDPAFLNDLETKAVERFHDLSAPPEVSRETAAQAERRCKLEAVNKAKDCAAVTETQTVRQESPTRDDFAPLPSLDEDEAAMAMPRKLKSQIRGDLQRLAAREGTKMTIRDACAEAEVLIASHRPDAVLMPSAPRSFHS